MIRFHLSDINHLVLKPREYNTHPYNFKPGGFWYDVNMDWIRWIVAEGYENDPRWMKKNLYRVAVDLSRVLCIRSAEELDQFHQAHIIKDPRSDALSFINWAKVRDQYAGVEIAPYIWSRRLHFDLNYMWYYGWDCASGVIWNLEAVQRVTLAAKGRDIIKLYRSIKKEETDDDEA